MESELFHEVSFPCICLNLLRPTAPSQGRMYPTSQKDSDLGLLSTVTTTPCLESAFGNYVMMGDSAFLSSACPLWTLASITHMLPWALPVS